jgi:UbiD family decarboxylase
VPIRQGPLRTGKYHLLKSPDLPQSLPLLKYSREDATPYLTAGILLTRHPSSGRRQLCFVRMAMVGGHRLLLNPATPHVRSLVNDTLGQGQELPLAVLIGPPVEIILLAGLSVPDGVDKLEVGQAMAGDGLAFSEETLPIPLGTEYVLKGRLIPQYGKEGPFGDLKGLYSVKEKNPLFFVDELRVAHDPLFHSISAGRAREHVTLVSMGPLVLLESLKRDCPGIVRYELPRFGGGRLAVFVVKQGFNPDAIAARLWRIPILRGFVFINEDVNRQSAEDLWWALLQRAKDRDNFRFSEEKHDVFQERKFVIDATAGDLASWENRRVAVFAPGKAR